MSGLDLMKNVSVKCDQDGCGWSQKIEPTEFPDWHNKACPSCGKGIIINNADMDVYRGLVALCAVQEFIDPKGEMPKELVKINTADLRKEPN